MIKCRRIAWDVVRATIDAAVVLALVVGVSLVVRGERASVPVSASTGHQPQLPPAVSTPPPTVNITHALGGSGGAAVSTAAGLRVSDDMFNAVWRVNAVRTP